MLGPRIATRYPDRFLECEEALESYFLAVMDLAVESGWRPDEAAVAINSLADHFVLKLFATDEITEKVSAAKQAR